LEYYKHRISIFIGFQCLSYLAIADAYVLSTFLSISHSTVRRDYNRNQSKGVGSFIPERRWFGGDWGGFNPPQAR
jgi:hypothetical protein